MAGRALVLTGPSGVGKTAVGLRLQQMLPESWLFYEVDRVQPRPPERAEFATVENDRRMRRAVLCAARAYLDAGFSVIIEIGAFDETDRRAVDEALAGISTTVVALTCTKSTLEQHLDQRSSLVDKEWARQSHRQFDQAGIKPGLIETTDDRSPAEVARAVAGYLSRDISPGPLS